MELIKIFKDFLGFTPKKPIKKKAPVKKKAPRKKRK